MPHILPMCHDDTGPQQQRSNVLQLLLRDEELSWRIDVSQGYLIRWLAAPNDGKTSYGKDDGTTSASFPWENSAASAHALCPGYWILKFDVEYARLYNDLITRSHQQSSNLPFITANHALSKTVLNAVFSLPSFPCLVCSRLGHPALLRSTSATSLRALAITPLPSAHDNNSIKLTRHLSASSKAPLSAP